MNCTPRETAGKLIALATDSAANEEEARTAAMAAVRLIAKHGLIASSDAEFKPAAHCAGCRCYSNEDVGRYKPRPEPSPWWRRDFDDRPKTEAERAYAAGWDAIWGPPKR